MPIHIARPVSTHFALLMALLFLFFSGTIAATPEARTYEMSQRLAEDVARQIRELYPDGQISITARGQQMVVRGEPSVLDEIGMLVETMDVAPVQMRITVRSRNSVDSKSGGVGVSGDNNRVNIQAERKVTTTRRNQERTLVVQDGQSAHITSGQVRTVPIAIRGGRNPAAFLDQVETRSGFLVSPQVISDQAIELNIVSYEEDPDSDMPGYETEALMTIRRVEPGEWVELGSTRERRVGKQSGIIYQTSGNSRQNQTFEVRVELF
ncbi:type II and III secretion system protein [Marinobacter panjinensis]|uniref:Type II and III secretion system protein n=1 Tax=Marinobacter panjinensis TaxID=2576384 RepID=A0A4V6CU96_9GAMM|nr:type II and III secretion system protein [Marinobacter panjinensis]MCR8914703.1 secretin [Marinobacter panjinensis]TKV68485.1 type II and III secretion system protein [Marinobacter panjinensis]